MESKTISTSLTPEINITEVAGNLLVKGWEQAEVQINAEPDDLVVEELDDSISIRCDADCDIYVPHGAMLNVTAVHGNAHFKQLEDQLTIGQVHGSLTLRSVAGITIKEVNGDLSSKAIAGDLIVERVHGNASIRSVQGNCHIDETEGNLDLRKIDGDILAVSCGNARLRLNTITGIRYQIKAESNLYCHIPNDADVQLNLSSEGEVIKIKLPGEANTLRQEKYELTLGDGKVNMDLQAGGALYVFGREVNESDREDEFGAAFEEMFEQQFESQLEGIMASVSLRLGEQMERLEAQISQAGLSADQTERIIEQARAASERGAERAQEKVRRAQEKIERKLEAARRHEHARAKMAEQHAHARRKRGWSIEWDSSSASGAPTTATPSRENASEEERLLILRMLEQKKISMEEAEQLLSALEG